jgi:cold shock CspA family protein
MAVQQYGPSGAPKGPPSSGPSPFAGKMKGGKDKDGMMKGKDGGKGKDSYGKGGKGPSATYPRPSWMPAAGQLVTLGDGVGWFIPVEAIEPEYPSVSPVGGGMMAGMKRPAPADWGNGPVMKGKGPKGGKGIVYAQYPPGAVVENPGLEEGEHIFTGTIKHVPNAKTGFGFISDENVAAQYGGKDAFLHLAIVPWIEQMTLQVGDIVHFNVELNEKQAPQVKRIVKAD